MNATQPPSAGLRLERSGRQVFTVPVDVEFPGPDGKQQRGRLRATFEAPSQQEMQEILASVAPEGVDDDPAAVRDALMNSELSPGRFLARVLLRVEGILDPDGAPYPEEEQLELGRTHGWVSRAMTAAFWKAWNSGSHVKGNSGASRAR